jgi:hypothetical protein
MSLSTFMAVKRKVWAINKLLFRSYTQSGELPDFIDINKIKNLSRTKAKCPRKIDIHPKDYESRSEYFSDYNREYHKIIKQENIKNIL